MSKYSARPPQTPPIILLVVDLVSRRAMGPWCDGREGFVNVAAGYRPRDRLVRWPV